METKKLARFARLVVLGTALCAGIGATGCAADASSPDDQGLLDRKGVAQVRRDVHFDLAAQASGGSYALEIAGRKYPLAAHDATTLASYRAHRVQHGLSATVAPTHYVGAASFSNEAPQLYRVVKIENNGLRSTVLSGLHLPGTGLEDKPLLVTPEETAIALAFQDPGLMTVDTDTAKLVKAHIASAPSFPRLVEAIKTFGPATSMDDQAKYHSGYQVTVVSKDHKGNPITVTSPDPKVKPHLATHWVTAGSAEYYAAGFHDRYIVVNGDRVKAPTPFDMVGAVRAEARLAVRDDTSLMNRMFTLQTDRTTRPLTARGMLGEAPASAEGGASARSDQDQNLKVALDDTQWKGDRRIAIESVEGRKVTFSVHNNGWRRQGVAVRFRDVNGEMILRKDIDGEQPESEAFEYINDGLKYSTILGIVDGRFTVLGVPLSAETVEKYTIELPKNASSFEVNIASAGFKSIDTPDFMRKSAVKDEVEPQIRMPGEVSTELLDVALPILALTVGVGAEHLGPKNPLVKAVATVGVQAGVSLLMHAAATGASGVNAFTRDYAYELLTDVLTSTPAVATALLQWSIEVSAEEALEAPLECVAQALETIERVGTAVMIAETIGTMATNAPITYDRIAASETLDIEVTPKDPYFSPYAQRVAAYIYFGSSTVPTVVRQDVDTKANGGNGPKSIPIVLPNQPVGGDVKVKIALESNDGWVAGNGEVTVKNEAGSDNRLVVPVAVEQNPVPIDTTTRYQHDRVLTVNGQGKHEWLQTKSAPAEVGPTVCNTGDTSRPWICGDASMTFNNDGVLGYSWTASSTTLATCDGKTNVAASVAQSINVNPNAGDGTPDARLKKSPCGSLAPVYVAFDPNGAPSGGKHVLVQQVTETLEGVERPVYEVFPMDIGMPGPIAPDQATSLGHFRSQHLDSIVLNPTTGMLLGLDKSQNAIEVLQLADKPMPFATAPSSVVLGGAGTSIGRLHDATALAFLPAGAGLLVLEAGSDNAAGRVQAFTFDGATVPMFGNQSAFALNAADKGVTYTDMKIDPTESYVYVSSYVGTQPTANDYRLDIYKIADGSFVTRTVGVVAAKMAIDKWRDLYTLNYARIAPNLPEPSVSLWIAPPVERK